MGGRGGNGFAKDGNKGLWSHLAGGRSEWREPRSMQVYSVLEEEEEPIFLFVFENALGTFEGKILRRIYRPVKKGSVWRKEAVKSYITC